MPKLLSVFTMIMSVRLLTQHRAKALRSAQNRRAYERRVGPEKPSLRLPIVPKWVQELAALPLPKSSHLFSIYFRSKDEISEDNDLTIWERLPPYPFKCGLLHYGVEDTSDALHGHRHRLQLEFENERLVQYKQLPTAAFMEGVFRNLLETLADAKELKTVVKRFKSSKIDFVMGSHLLQWKARRIISLVKDWKALKAGNDRFIIEYTEQW